MAVIFCLFVTNFGWKYYDMKVKILATPNAWPVFSNGVWLCVNQNGFTAQISF